MVVGNLSRRGAKLISGISSQLGRNYMDQNNYASNCIHRKFCSFMIEVKCHFPRRQPRCFYFYQRNVISWTILIITEEKINLMKNQSRWELLNLFTGKFISRAPTKRSHRWKIMLTETLSCTGLVDKERSVHYISFALGVFLVPPCLK